MKRQPIKPEDRGYVCGSHENDGVCATCPQWCKGRPAFDASLPKWTWETPGHSTI